MKSGQGRLTLLDGTDLPLEYRIANQEFGSRCQGTLIGDLGKLTRVFSPESSDLCVPKSGAISVLVTNYSDRHITFIGEYEPAEEVAAGGENPR